MASSVTTSAQWAQLLLPGASSITSYYPYYQNEWKSIFKIMPSIKAAEVDIEMGTVNGAGYFNEGSQMPMTSVGDQAFVTNTRIQNWGVGFTVTSIAIDDNLYQDEFPKGVVGIRENLNILSEYNGIALFDNAFSGANPQYVLGDGQPMCSFSHPISNGTVSNMINPAELNETSLEDLVALSQQFYDFSGLPRKIEAKRCLVGIQNQFIATALFGSTYRPENTTNAVNPITYGQYLSDGWVLSHYMANQGNWFILTDFEDGLVNYQRKTLQITLSVDQANQNIGVYGSERYAFRCINFRSVLGSQG